jgi:tetratricopeptide (TPR) repeat protein
MSKANWLSIVLLFCSALSACTDTLKPEQPEVYTSSLDYEERGFKAQAKKEYAQAIAHYQNALKLRRSVEDTQGIAINLVNLAVLYQHLGKNTEAHAALAEALALPKVESTVRATAAYEYAKLYWLDNDLASAKRWLDKSLSFDDKTRIESRFNLLARIALAEGQRDEALHWANAALEANREGKHSSEQANSLRIIAKVKADKGNILEAKDVYLQALALDKQAGESAKIALDLNELGKLALQSGKTGEAKDFFHRAEQVRQNTD